jgi:hypothetical protein
LDLDHRVIAAQRSTPDGGVEIVVPDGKGGWTVRLAIPPDDVLSTDTLDADARGRTLYVRTPVGRETAALLALDLATGKTRVLASDAQADVTAAIIHPTTKVVQGAPRDVAVDPDRRRGQEGPRGAGQGGAGRLRGGEPQRRRQAVAGRLHAR